MDSNKVCFISDAHFGIDLPGQEDRERLFFRFLEREISDVSEIYLVGDIFDFWIEYNYSIRPDYFLVLHHLKTVIDAGVSIHYLAGNHDFALGPFLEQTIGMTIHPGAISHQIQGKMVHIYHGDGLIKKDVGYRILKKILRNTLNQRLYKLLHPGIGIPLGSFVSGSSRKYKGMLPEAFINKYRECARNILKKNHDVVIYAHIHRPELIRYPDGIYCNIGAWLQQYTYAIMENGTISLFRYKDGSTAEELPLQELK